MCLNVYGCVDLLGFVCGCVCFFVRICMCTCLCCCVFVCVCAFIYCDVLLFVCVLNVSVVCVVYLFKIVDWLVGCLIACGCRCCCAYDSLLAC